MAGFALARNRRSRYRLAPFPQISVTQRLNDREQALTRGGRCLIALVGVVLVAVWAVACWLEPDPRGFGTHERLGFAPCSFRVWTGRPCPSCGMTTAFANLARGRVLEAAQANLAGVLIALVTLVVVPWCFVSARQGKLVGLTDPARSLLALLVPIIGLSVVNWLVNLVLSD